MSITIGFVTDGRAIGYCDTDSTKIYKFVKLYNLLVKLFYLQNSITAYMAFWLFLSMSLYFVQIHQTKTTCIMQFIEVYNNFIKSVPLVGRKVKPTWKIRWEGKYSKFKRNVFENKILGGASNLLEFIICFRLYC